MTSESIGMHVEGQVEENELRWLHARAGEMDSVVEIGSWKGRNTYGICSSGCPHVYAVDPFPKPGDICEGHFVSEDGYCGPFKYRAADPNQYEEYIGNVGHFTNLTTLKMRSEDAAVSDLVPPEIDMVFIDGNHYYEFVIQDLRLWTPKTRILVSGHDYNFAEVQKAVDEYFGKDNITLGPGSIWHIFVDK